MPKPVSQPQPNLNSENRLFEHALSDGHVLKLSLSAEKECKSALTKDGVPVRNYVFRAPEKETVTKLCGRVSDPSKIKCKTFGGDLIEIGVEDPQEGLRGGGNLNFKPAPIQKPKGTETSECKEPYKSGFVHLVSEFRRNSLSKSTPQPGLPSITDMRSTRELALTIKALADKKKKNANEKATHDDFVKFVRESIMTAFGDIKPKTPRVLQELTELVLSDNKEICRDVLTAIFSEVTGATFKHGNIELLQALQDVLRKSNPAHFNQLHLVEILTTIAGTCSKIHSQYATLPELHTHVEVVADILVAMADAKVRGISYTEVHDPLFQFLEKVAKDPNQIVFTNKKAQLALEALKCIKHDKTNLDINFHRLVALAKGVNYVMAAPLDGGMIESAEGLIDSLRAAFYKQSKEQGWYPHFRFLDVLIKNRQWKTFQTEFLKVIKAIPPSEYPDLLTNIVYSLNVIVISDMEHTDDRIEALNILRLLYINDGNYSLRTILHSQLFNGSDRDVRGQIHEELLREFLDHACSSNSRVSERAKTILEKIQTTKLKGLSEETWFANVGLDKIDIDALEQLPPKGIAIERTHELLTAARALKVKSVATRIREMRNEYGNPENPAIKLRLDTFGELEGRDISPKEGVQKKESLQNWLKSDQKVALRASIIVGDGKTTFVQMIHQPGQAMHPALPPKTVVVQIGGDAIKTTAEKAVTNELRKHFGESNLNDVLNDYNVIVICNGLNTRELQSNFFLANKECKNLRLVVEETLVPVKETLLKWLKSDQRTTLVESIKGGSGKTTLIDMMHHLAWKMHSEFPPKTVIVQIRADAVQSTARHVVSNVLRKKFTEDGLEEILNDYTVIALCDELDANEFESNFFLANIECKNLRILFTGRKAHLPHKQSDLMDQLCHPTDNRLLHIRLMPFDAARSKETLAKYITHDPLAPCKQQTSPGVFPYKEWTISKL